MSFGERSTSDLLTARPEEIVVTDAGGYLVLTLPRRGIYRVTVTRGQVVVVAGVLAAIAAGLVTLPLGSGQTILTLSCAAITCAVVFSILCWLLVPVAQLWPQHVDQRHWLAGIETSRSASDVRLALRYAGTSRSTLDVLAHLSSGEVVGHERDGALRRLNNLCAHAVLAAVDEF